MYPAVYFTKSGLPWQAELTLSPLVEAVGTSYFVHLLRPSAETAVETIVDAAVLRPESPGAARRRLRTALSAANGAAPRGGHSVISLTGLSTAVQVRALGLDALATDHPPSPPLVHSPCARPPSPI